MSRLERRVSELEKDRAAFKAGISTVGKIGAAVLVLTGTFSTVALAVKSVFFGK